MGADVLRSLLESFRGYSNLGQQGRISGTPEAVLHCKRRAYLGYDTQWSPILSFYPFRGTISSRLRVVTKFDIKSLHVRWKVFIRMPIFFSDRCRHWHTRLSSKKPGASQCGESHYGPTESEKLQWFGCCIDGEDRFTGHFRLQSHDRQWRWYPSWRAHTNG